MIALLCLAQTAASDSLGRPIPGLERSHLSARLLVDVLRDRGALLRETSDGRIENAYTLQLMNLDDAPHEYTVSVSGLPGVEIVGECEFSTEPGSIRPLMITVSAPGEAMLSGIQPIHFEIAAKHDAATRVQEKSSFVLP